MRRSLLVFLATMALVRSVNAGAYPDKPVRLIVPFSAGAAADSVARPLAAKLSQYWGQQVLVENRGGLTVGAQAAAGAAADGYTLLFGAASTMVTTPLTVAKLPYDVRRDFIPITRLVTLPPILTVNPALGVKSLKELIALAKARPGQLNYASSGMGAPNHLGMEYLLAMTGADMEHVPYKGAAPGVVDLVGNQVQAGFNALPSVLAHIKAGRLTALAVGTRHRSRLLPDVPAVGETVPGFEYVAWYGLFAPTGTPAAIAEKIRVDATRALAAPEVAQVLLAEGSDPAPGSGPELARLIEEETELWRRIIKERNLKME